MKRLDTSERIRLFTRTCLCGAVGLCCVVLVNDSCPCHLSGIADMIAVSMAHNSAAVCNVVATFCLLACYFHLCHIWFAQGCEQDRNIDSIAMFASTYVFVCRHAWLGWVVLILVGWVLFFWLLCYVALAKLNFLKR